MSDINNYLLLDEAKNAMDYLIQSLVFLAQIEQNKFYLKWFIIAFHGAIYSFMLLALQSIDQRQIYKKIPDYKNGKNNLKKKNSDPFGDKLIEFLTVYKYLKSSKRMLGQPFVASAQHDKCVKELNDKLRNQLVHFKPMVWASESWYPARVCRPLLDVLKFCINSERINITRSEKAIAQAYLDSVDRLLAKHVI